MVHVLVIGANGYIGNEVAVALRKRGHIVYGCVRKDSEFKCLEQAEIIPVKGDLQSVPADILDRVSVVIDTAMNFADNPALSSNRVLLETVAAASRKSGVKKRYIYTSGCLVYGEHKGEVVDETFPLKSGHPRIAFEKEITSHKDVDGVVIRPSWVYGGKGNMYLKSWYEGSAEGNIEISGKPDKCLPWVHVSDLAEAYLRVTEAGRGSVSGEVFDVADSSRGTVEQVQVAWARANGVKGKVVYKPAGTDFFSQLCEQTALPSAEKIKRVLGWCPRMGPVLDNTAIYARAFHTNRSS